MIELQIVLTEVVSGCGIKAPTMMKWLLHMLCNLLSDVAERCPSSDEIYT